MRDYEEIVGALRMIAKKTRGFLLMMGEKDLQSPKLYEDAADAIEELLAAVPHWISVEERLPEPGEVVITYNSPLGLQNYGIDLVLDGEWNFDEFTQWWMPLPEAPKEETDGSRRINS